MMKMFIFYLSFLFTRVSWLMAGTKASINSTTTIRRQRERRALIFPNGGTIKFSVGPSMPVHLLDQVSWRSMVCSYTLQGGQYNTPDEPLYPWDKWEDTFARSLQHMKSKFEHYGACDQDESRAFLYNVFEDFMNRNNASRHQCMLRVICENAQVRGHEGIFAQVLNVVLTPGKEKLDKSYRMALQAGRHGADCLKLYYLCPKGQSLLDQYIDEI